MHPYLYVERAIECILLAVCMFFFLNYFQEKILSHKPNCDNKLACPDSLSEKAGKRNKQRGTVFSKSRHNNTVNPINVTCL